MKRLIIIYLVFVILLSACNFPGAEPTPEKLAETPTLRSIATSGEASILHLTQPNELPAERSGHAGDFDSSISAANQEAAGGDRHTFGKVERSFNANSMDIYFENLDIVDTYVFQDDTWIYGQIFLKGSDSDNINISKYAMELDLDIDGRGDYLIVAALDITSDPSTTDWTVEGVSIFWDQNKDVGDKTAMYTDENAKDGDGFEVEVFNSGHGDDPDSGWVRVTGGSEPKVEIAVKRSLLGNPDKYLIGMWAGTTLLDPVLFDINDHFTHEEAGAADRGLPFFYPINFVYELDNACRMAVGFAPTGNEPGLCKTLIPQSEGGGNGTCQDPGNCYLWTESLCECIPFIFE